MSSLKSSVVLHLVLPLSRNSCLVQTLTVTLCLGVHFCEIACFFETPKHDPVAGATIYCCQVPDASPKCEPASCVTSKYDMSLVQPPCIYPCHVQSLNVSLFLV